MCAGILIHVCKVHVGPTLCTGVLLKQALKVSIKDDEKLVFFLSPAVLISSFVALTHYKG